MTLKNLSPMLRQRFFDQSGVPLAGGLLYTYTAGTTTPLVTYSNQSGTTNSNPVVLDAYGYCDVWLDPALNYKFVLQDVNAVVQWTEDNVSGAQVFSVFGASGTNHASGAVPDPGATPGTTKFLREDATWVRPASTVPTVSAATATGTGTGGFGSATTGWLFTISTSTTCSAGDTYTNNGNTYVVLGALAAVSGQVLFMSGAAAPQSSGNLTRATGSGTATVAFTLATALSTYTTPTSPAPLYLKVKLCGAGGGGGGGHGTNGVAGKGTFFGVTGPYGLGGGRGIGDGTGADGGAGGAASLGSAIGVALPGGMGVGEYISTSVISIPGGAGGNTPYFGGGGTCTAAAVGNAGNTNSGGGGAGGGISAASTLVGAAGGGSGGFVEGILVSPATTFYYCVGTGGAAGTAGSSGFAGGAGAAGQIVVEEFYQ